MFLNKERVNFFERLFEMDEQVRAIIVDLSKRFGGASIRTVTLAQGLKSWDVAVAGLSGSPVVEMARKKGIHVLTMGTSKVNPLIPLRLAIYIRQGGYQILDTQNIQSKFWGSIAALLTNTALVSTLNSWYTSEHGDSLKGKIYASIDLLTNWKTKRYIVVSEMVRKQLSCSGIVEERIDLIRNAIEVKGTFSLEPNVFRKKLGLPKDAIIYVAVGRLVWAKGFEDFISAFSSVASQINNIYAIIIGDGILYDTLKKQVEHYGLNERMFLLGFKDREEVLEILHCSNIFVMPSRSEGLPFALLEAAALGLPIVATDCGGIPEIVTDNEEALLVPIGDTLALASAMETLFKDSNMARRLGKNAVDRIRNDFSPSALIIATKQAYLQVVK